MDERPRIGITVDKHNDRLNVRNAYVSRIVAAGGLPLLMPPVPELAGHWLAICDGFVFSGGDDPIMEDFGVPTHPRAKPVDRQRQMFELKLLRLLEDRPDVPAMGICLGMQYMALAAGGVLDQHLPDTLSTHGDHWAGTTHAVTGLFGGEVHSHHRQAMRCAGSLDCVAWSHDGLIEAVADEARTFYLGVQWHPERTDDPALGAGLFRRLVSAAASEVMTVNT